MSERTKPGGPLSVAERCALLEARVSDLENCLARLCERLGEYRVNRGRFGNPPDAANGMELVSDLVEIIKRHPLGG